MSARGPFARARADGMRPYLVVEHRNGREESRRIEWEADADTAVARHRPTPQDGKGMRWATVDRARESDMLVIGTRRHTFDIEAARAEVAAFEAEYGTSSDRYCEPFTVRGRLIETHDWRRWDWLLSCLERAGVDLRAGDEGTQP